jgi:hypothetical protein
MKVGLYRLHFLDNAATAADFYECSMQALPDRWQICIASGSDYVDQLCFVAENLPYLTLFCTFYML